MASSFLLGDVVPSAATSLVANAAAELVEERILGFFVEKLGQPDQRSPPLPQNRPRHGESHSCENEQRGQIRRARLRFEATYAGLGEIPEHEGQNAPRKLSS